MNDCQLGIPHSAAAHSSEETGPSSEEPGGSSEEMGHSSEERTQSSEDMANSSQEIAKTSPNKLSRVPLGMLASHLGITQETLSRVRAEKDIF